jgi:2-polyprenyl-6-methoxyphenol hydroxylase-like FAD-dependent oxidoreductase
MALEDAVILAKALRDAPTTAAALADFDRVRRPRVENNIVASAELSAGRLPSRDGTNGRPPALTNDELMHQLAWTTPLPAGNPT